ncbi:hypothetical protein BGZ83_001770 [Gryganskiella cystojenkinii]|nr:hypothetical protein BGZ83_001770 [Gryganskiella cystojenkinii]
MDSAFPPRDQIQEQRRALAEDTVSYAIYLRPTTEDTVANPSLPPNESHHSDHDTVTTSFESAQVAKTLISSIVQQIAGGYIWHKDAFSLRIQTGRGQVPSTVSYLRGETRFGDCLDDEWLVVHLLREITKRIPGSIARVQDNDGEFLLIEAADHIPSWLDPDNSDNRVFLYEGNLHIIPIATTEEEKKTFPVTTGSKSKAPKLQDALDMIWQSGEDQESSSSYIPATRASARIQQAAFAPLSDPVRSSNDEEQYAAIKTQEQKHYARCQIPVAVARILKKRPELVTRACEAFYTRDAAAMAVCSRMEKFLPSSSSTTVSSPTPLGRKLGKNATEFVTTAVCFTRTCYAQLMGQQFHPPKIWDGIVPSVNVDEANNPQRAKEADLGMKLTCGFEILCSPDYPGDFGFKEGQQIKPEEFSFATDNGWRIFKTNLVARQYFGDERPGSKKYQELEQTAQKQYLENKSEQLLQQEESSTNDESNEDPSVLGSVSFYGHGFHPVQEIEQILNSTTKDDTEKSLVDDREDDDDTWMNVDLQVLEDMMRSRGFGGGASMETEEPSKSSLDMQQMLDRFGEFIQEGQGGVDGAEFLDEKSDEDDEDEDDEEENEKEDASSESESEATDEDEDIFASDYEEKQAQKRATKSGASFGAFVFETDDIETNITANQPQQQQQPEAGFELDHGRFKDILTKTFGVPSAGQSSAARVSTPKDESDEEEEIDGDGGLKEYMAKLDAELSSTKVGQSFEKTIAPRFTSVKNESSSSADKGRAANKDKAAKPEKNLEDLLKQYTERSRRGISRQGPLPMAGASFGYDPALMAFADDEDEDEDDEEEEISSHARVSAISPDDELGDEIDDDEDVEEIVDIDMNLAKNLLESFKSQGGLPGPGGNLLSRLGIVLPRDEDDDDIKDNDSE